MFRTNCFLILLSAIFISPTVNSTAQAKDCGGNIPCACGDNVVAHRTLVSGVDPVARAVCTTQNGLIMNIPGVVLDLNGSKLRGSGNLNTVGVLIAANGVTILDGRVDNFGTGIGGATNSSTLRSVKPYYNKGDGISLNVHNTQFIASPARHNGNNGYTLFGDNNFLEGQNNEYNGFDGMFVQGNGNHFVANKASENRKKGPGNGITVIGDNNKIEKSRISKKNTNGIVVMGDGNALKENVVRKQGGDGIVVDGDNAVLTDNYASANNGVGISVAGDGNAAASTGNRVSLNRHPQCEIYTVTEPPTCIEEFVP